MFGIDFNIIAIVIIVILLVLLILVSLMLKRYQNLYYGEQLRVIELEDKYAVNEEQSEGVANNDLKAIGKEIMQDLNSDLNSNLGSDLNRNSSTKSYMNQSNSINNNELEVNQLKLNYQKLEKDYQLAKDKQQAIAKDVISLEQKNELLTRENDGLRQALTKQKNNLTHTNSEITSNIKEILNTYQTLLINPEYDKEDEDIIDYTQITNRKILGNSFLNLLRDSVLIENKDYFILGQKEKSAIIHAANGDIVLIDAKLVEYSALIVKYQKRAQFWTDSARSQ